MTIILLKSHRSFRSTGFHFLSCRQNDPNEVNRAKLKLSYCAMFFYSQKLSKDDCNYDLLYNEILESSKSNNGLNKWIESNIENK